MHRFFVSSNSFQGKQVVLSSEQAHQIRNVLRMGPGQRIIVLDGEGWEFEVLLEQVEPAVVTGKVLSKQLALNEPDAQLTLYQSLIKRDKFEWVLQKCTEVGVSRFVPLVTQRSIVQKPEAITANKVARWQRIVTEAAEQSRRGWVPELDPVVTFTKAIDSLDKGQLALIPWEQAGGMGIRKALSETSGARSVTLFIGPEGGFSTEEVAYAQSRGVIPVTLGPRILRSETAAVVVAAILLHELGELT